MILKHDYLDNDKYLRLCVFPRGHTQIIYSIESGESRISLSFYRPLVFSVKFVNVCIIINLFPWCIQHERSANKTKILRAVWTLLKDVEEGEGPITHNFVSRVIGGGERASRVRPSYCNPVCFIDNLSCLSLAAQGINSIWSNWQSR